MLRLAGCALALLLALTLSVWAALTSSSGAPVAIDPGVMGAVLGVALLVSAIVGYVLSGTAHPQDAAGVLGSGLYLVAVGCVLAFVGSGGWSVRDDVGVGLLASGVGTTIVGGAVSLKAITRLWRGPLSKHLKDTIIRTLLVAAGGAAVTIAAFLARGPSDWDGTNYPGRIQLTGLPLVMMGVAITLAVHTAAHADSHITTPE